LRVAIVTHVVRHNDGQGRVNHEIARAALDENIGVTLVASHVAPELLAHPNVRWVPVKIGRWWPTNLLRQQVFALKSALRRLARERLHHVDARRRQHVALRA
jgi:hypothetical protein